MGARRLYDTRDLAKNMRETFTGKPVKEEIELPFGWPPTMQHVGDSLGVAYQSDKLNGGGDGNWTLFKHIAESTNRALVVPGFLVDFDRPSRPWPTIGPLVSLRELPLPKHFALLALFEEVNLKLHTRGTHREPAFGPGADEGVVTVALKDGHLGGVIIPWSKLDAEDDDEPALIVYDGGGVKILIVGEQLGIETDGIVG